MISLRTLPIKVIDRAVSDGEFGLPDNARGKQSRDGDIRYLLPRMARAVLFLTGV